ncbi:16S rRNA (guanine(966)-N(2))-methyltransferase RsmD [Nocardioides sp. Bht2]|uniref:16S rRNA (guanine(966)-N(2))-methyltransferase RsmD n=1 Tax=Nocardioides sp. Bht2 TaxID=3392297 RepID=UPI0039B3E667
MTRIIAGTAGGRRLETPRTGELTRPTSDRVREALFSSVETWCGSWSGLRVLDLYAGTGAVGLEALSRGAASLTLVEQDRATAALISRNAKTLGFDATVITANVTTTLGVAPSEPFDLVFLDPPYPMSDAEVEETLAALVANDWLAPDALIVVERSARSGVPTWPEGIEAGREKRYGETVLGYGHTSP